MEIHVVSKIDNCQHATVSVGVSGSPSGVASSDEAAGAGGELAQENLAITARPILLSLTSNNLSYARSGEMLHWCVRMPSPPPSPFPFPLSKGPVVAFYKYSHLGTPHQAISGL